MIADGSTRVCERMDDIEAALADGSELEIRQALSDLDALSDRVWRRKPVTLADLREHALIARAHMDKDETGAPEASCALSRATLHLIDAVLRLTDA